MKTILLATDYSKQQTTRLHTLVELAKFSKTKLVLFMHIIFLLRNDSDSDWLIPCMSLKKTTGKQ